MELSLIKDYVVCGLPGSGVNFVAAFLDVEHKADTATLRIDIDKEYAAQFDEGIISVEEKHFKFSHDLCIDNDNKCVIKILCKDMTETLKIIYNNYCSKRFNLERMSLVELVDRLLCNSDLYDLSTYQDNHIKLWTKQYDINNINKANYILNYQDLFNLDILEKIFIAINNRPLPDYKISYFNSYKEHHDLMFYDVRYKIFEKILKFEYNNNLTEQVSGKMRAWSIDEINEDNWQEFLEEKLCPTNYS